ncbi:efflux RND transporter permease subunit [Nitrospirillum viridazoti]|uniref:Efflux pump membrane transporter n=1 Tax=Nitrospirillum amazonense TaxID=28077 RepID=A0A560IHW6_9PROT|nr:multidrug efflux RND transporter permease subunit [Nitrospirillum amazonense]TWB58586.1 HAE1 family hydrophobic/amphiphilic exporter-1 [Nitrospirillum amazonense]
MKFSHFFIDRPIFACVISILITLIGGLAYFALPVAQYPEVAPPTVVVTATYPGASAETVANTVAAPLEQEINGVDDMLYMVSQNTGDGGLSLTITFKLGTDIDKAQVLVQNRVSVAQPHLPDEVNRLGVTTRKNSPNLMMVIHLYSPDDSLDQLYISNYATLQVRDPLARLDGVGDARIRGAGDYSMRVWLDPEKVQARGLTTAEVVQALQGNNVQVASGQLNHPPVPKPSAFEVQVQTLGRLTDPSQFADIVIKSDAQGRVTRVRDVGWVELGAQDYNTYSYVDGQRAAAILIYQRPGSNALKTAANVLSSMETMSHDMPKGMAYKVVYNPTNYIAESVKEVYHTIFEAVVLVVIVVIVFLQSWRAALIPVIAIPISLIGTFAVMAAVGFSLNNLSLFGLVLAIGIVVDDAIVVVENVERNLAQGLSPREAAHRTMDEVGGALVAIALVLTAVFLPTAFLTGIAGEFYRQFGVTIAAATVISMLVSQTLSPALAALLLKPHVQEHAAPRRGFHPVARFFGGFNRGFDWLSERYGRLTGHLVRLATVVLVVYAGLIVLGGGLISRTPTGFIPAQDQGYFITVIQLPPGSSLARTDAILRHVQDLLSKRPGVAHTVGFAGFDGATFTNAPNAGAVFVATTPFAERGSLTTQGIFADLQKTIQQVDGALILLIPPPTVPGIGSSGGFKLYIEDRRSRGLQALADATQDMMLAANQTPGLANVFSLYNTRTPQVYADIDRVKADMLGVPPSRIFDTLNVYLGSAFVNDFNLLGRTYRVTAQADGADRTSVRDIAYLRTRSNSGGLVPLGSVATFRDVTGPYRVPRYNLYPAAELQGSPAPGYSTGQAIAAVQQLAQQRLPDGFAIEWTELTFQQIIAGNTAPIAFGLAVVFVYLLLAALYESWMLPLSVILIVPMCLLTAISGVNLRGMDNNILTQIGLVVLVGLAAKNAILIVEFAKQDEEEGMDRFQAAVRAARTRLRPILMTSFAFILGVVPLVNASGAGSEMRQALGTAVFFGMLGVTFFGLLFTPVFYVVCRWLALWGQRRFGKREETPPHAGPPHAGSPGHHTA